MAHMAKRVDVGDKGKYRKIDVDAIDEDLYREDETDAGSFDQLVAQRAADVRGFLSKGALREAVARSLEQPPFGTKNQAIKVIDKRSKIIYQKECFLANSGKLVSKIFQINRNLLDLLTLAFGLSQDKNLETVIAALTSVKSAEIANVARSLSEDSLDVLMKYLYAGMASPEKYNVASLLAWHEVVVESAGLASIVRVLTDRKTV